MSQTANAAIAKARTRPVFYTRPGDEVQLALWLNTRTKSDKAPLLTGTFNGQQAAAYLHESNGRKFLSLMSNRKVDGSYDRLATANVVIAPNGYPKLLMVIAKKNIWAETTKEGTNDLLQTMGLDVAAMLTRRESYRAANNATQAA